MEFPKQLVLIGGGTSICEGVDLGLWNKIKNKFTNTLNFQYKYLDATYMTFVDPEFYNAYQGQFAHKWHDTEEKKQEHINALDNMGLILGLDCDRVQKPPRPNTVLFGRPEGKEPKTFQYYGHNSIKENKIYSPKLCGLFSLTLGLNILGGGEIYLLGFDNGHFYEDINDHPVTHFAQVVDPNHVKHRGIGEIGSHPTGYYDGDHEKEDWGVFKNDARVRIYNVSMNSFIPNDIFTKISYKTFFEKLDKNQYNQEGLREWVKGRITELRGK